MTILIEEQVPLALVSTTKEISDDEADCARDAYDYQN
jgi:hypothetical protein